MKPHGLPRALRIRRRREFVRAQQGGTKLHARHFMVFAMRSLVPRVSASATAVAQAAVVGAAGGAPSGPPARLGITVTRKVGPAVVRNRIKRWVREAFRRARPSWVEAMGRSQPSSSDAGDGRGVDLVFVAKRSAPAASYAEVVSDVQSIAAALARTQRRGRDDRRRSR